MHTTTTTTTADAAAAPSSSSGVSPRIVRGLLRNALEAFELFHASDGVGASFFPSLSSSCETGEEETEGAAAGHTRAQRVRAAVREVKRLRRLVRKQEPGAEGRLAAAVAASPVTGLRKWVGACVGVHDFCLRPFHSLRRTKPPPPPPPKKNNTQKPRSLPLPFASAGAGAGAAPFV